MAIPKNYVDYSNHFAPKSPCWKNFLKAFLIGGFICIIGQAIGDGLRWLGVSEEDVGPWTSVLLVGLGALLTALSIYDNIARHAGAGTLVPITGFSNAVSSAAMEFKSEGLVLGMAAKLFTIAGPVIVYGALASVVYGIIYLVI